MKQAGRFGRNIPATAGLVLLLLGSGCSDDRDDVGVRTGGTDPPDVLDLVTDASTTTSPIAPPTSRGSEDAGDGSDADAGIAPAATGGGVVVETVEQAPTGAPLGEVLLANGPTGWTAEAETAPDLGLLTPAQAAAAVGDTEAERSLLETRRLRLAYARRWHSPTGTSATVVGYAFADAEGALAYEVDSYLALVGAGASEVADLDRARGFTATMDGVIVHGRSLRVAERLFLVIVRGDAGDAAAADALLAAQRVRAGVR